MSLLLPFDSFVASREPRKRVRAGARARRFDIQRFASSGLADLPSIVRVRERVESMEARGEYVSQEGKRDLLTERACKRGRNGQDPRENLPILPEDTAGTLAKRYGATDERLQQALALHTHGLHGKAKRLVLCGRLGRRIDHQKSPDACERQFSEPYFCCEKYCTFCGPQQFRVVFAKLLNSLGPVVERLLCEGARKGREMVIAKLDFTIPNLYRMPRSEEVQEFHGAMHRFWRFAERIFGIERSEYGLARCDEIGGDNTNLHGHCAYVGSRLPQREKELSALWSIVLLPRNKSQRRRELLRFARKYGLGEVWNQLLPEERRFVSIKRAKSFAAALAHALKYPSKFLDKSSPQRLAALEKTFHKTRRVSTGGAFYRIKEVREPGDDREFDHAFCPFCKVRLVRRCEPWQPISVLESEGRINLKSAEREAGLRNALGDESPP